MPYQLLFLPSAQKEWDHLDKSVRVMFARKLVERLEVPRVASARLRNARNRYKIKLRDAGYRLVYEVNDEVVTVTVVAVGRRDDNEAYRMAARR